LPRGGKPTRKEVPLLTTLVKPAHTSRYSGENAHTGCRGTRRKKKRASVSQKSMPSYAGGSQRTRTRLPRILRKVPRGREGKKDELSRVQEVDATSKKGSGNPHKERGLDARVSRGPPPPRETERAVSVSHKGTKKEGGSPSTRGKWAAAGRRTSCRPGAQVVERGGRRILPFQRQGGRKENVERNDVHDWPA